MVCHCPCLQPADEVLHLHRERLLRLEGPDDPGLFGSFSTTVSFIGVFATNSEQFVGFRMNGWADRGEH